MASEYWAVEIVDDLSRAESELTKQKHQIIILDTASVSEPPWRVMEILREGAAHAAILLLVTPDTPWSSFSSYRQRPAGLILKPLDRTALLMAVDSALVYRKLLEENRTLKRQLGSTVSLGDWVGCTPEFQEVRRSIATAALATGTVLLAGEDGTGRRLAAELLHRHGRNPGSTFLPMDLESLPKGELRRLLNEVREAADTGRGSYVHGARPGTLYLAELTALVPEDQAALKEFLGETVPFRLMAVRRPGAATEARPATFRPRNLRRRVQNHDRDSRSSGETRRHPRSHRSFSQTILRAARAQTPRDPVFCSSTITRTTTGPAMSRSFP